MISLYDEEIVAAYQVVQDLTRKYGKRTWSNFEEFHKLTDEIEKDAKHNLFEVGLVASVNCAPMMSGEPPEVIIEGRVNPEQFDHSRKAWEVRRSKETGEQVYGSSRLR